FAIQFISWWDFWKTESELHPLCQDAGIRVLLLAHDLLRSSIPERIKRPLASNLPSANDDYHRWNFSGITRSPRSNQNVRRPLTCPVRHPGALVSLPKSGAVMVTVGFA